ncbi:hypothetical protein [Streptomyces cupreus]|uniref:hypothetical protein n=1 Tax=Streptomyces cupreus TaxID=2759956 RepID=UPI001C9147A0|nr:hypothetical protein [Streptomyces cupreus]
MTWQGKARQGFDLDSFDIDWAAQQVTCPQGHRSARWKPHIGRAGYPQTNVFFAPPALHPLPGPPAMHPFENRSPQARPGTT